MERSIGMQPQGGGAEKEGRVPLAVIIVNYRTPRLAIEAARSVLDDLVAIGGKLAIVDNHSGDGSAEILEEFAAGDPRRDRILLIPSPDNRGFAAGNNMGAKAVGADYYLLLNSDAVAEPGAVKELLAVARAHPNAGMVTPRLVDSAGRAQSSRFRRHSPLSELVEGAETGPVTRAFPRAEVAIAPDDWSAQPDWVSFAAVLLSGRAVDAVGPMDEDYFLYFEDCDYCLRMTRAGFSIAFAPKAAFRHDAGGSTKLREQTEKSARLPAYYYRARNRYFRKFYGAAGPIMANLAWSLGRSIAVARGLIGRPAPRKPEGRARDIWIGWRG